MHNEGAEMSEFLLKFYCQITASLDKRFTSIALLVLVASARLFAQAPVAGSSSTSAAVINNARNCSGFNGVTAGDKISASKSDLPSTGGTLDCTGIEGTITSDIF